MNKVMTITKVLRFAEQHCRAQEAPLPLAWRVSEILEGGRPANRPEETEESGEEFEGAKVDIEEEEEEIGHVELHQRGDAPKEPEDSHELDEGKKS